MNYRDMLLEEYLLDEAGKQYVEPTEDNRTTAREMRDALSDVELANTIAGRRNRRNYLRTAAHNIKQSFSDQANASRTGRNIRAINAIQRGRSWSNLTDNEKKAILRIRKNSDRTDAQGSALRRAVAGRKNSSKLNQGLQIGGSAAIVGGAAAAGAGLAKMSKLKNNGHEMYLAAKAAGKVKPGETEAQWLARQGKNAKIAAIAGGAAALAGGATKGITYGIDRHKNKGEYKPWEKKFTKKDLNDNTNGLDAGYSRLAATGTLHEMAEFEYSIYKNAFNEGLTMSYIDGYYDESMDDLAFIEAMDYADSIMEYMGEDTDGADIARAELLGYDEYDY